MIEKYKHFIHKHPTLINSLLILVSSFITIFSLEFLFRFYLSWFQPFLYSELSLYHQTAQADQSSMRFGPHPYLSFSRTDTQYDKNGLQIGDEYYTFEKPEGVIRIACLGGSTTMQQHPLFLKRFLEFQFNAPEYEVMDFGADSWTSQESLINYMIRIKDFSPDILLIHHAVNDGPPRIWGEFKQDYSNFRISWKDQSGWILRYFSKYSFLVNGILYIKGIMPFDIQNYVIQRLPPGERKDEPQTETSGTFQRNIKTLTTLAQNDGSQVILAPVNYNPKTISKLESVMIDEHSRFMIDYARENQITCVDTKWLLHQHEDWFLDSVHLKPPGMFMNTQLFTAAIRDTLRGYSEVLRQDGMIYHETIQHFDGKWQPQRRITLQWALHIPGVTDYHIYFREVGSNNNRFLANTRDPSIHTLEWSPDNRLIKLEFRDGPQIGKDYFFNVFAIVGEHPYPAVGPVTEKGVFEIEDKIVYLPNAN